MKQLCAIKLPIVLLSAYGLSSSSAFAPVGLKPKPIVAGVSSPHSTAILAAVRPEESQLQANDTERRSTDPTPALATAWKHFTGDNPTTSLAVAAALTMVLLFSPLTANAAMSGGRMGGSYSSPSTRSMPSRSYGGGGYSQGFRSGYYSRPSVTIAPTITPFGGFSPFYSPFAFPRPFFFGGPGVITYSRGPSFLDLVIFGGISFVIFNAVRNAAVGNDITTSFSSWTDAPTSVLGSGTSVVQISVALDVPNRDDRNSILSVLDRLAQTAKTDSRVGIQNLTSQVALELLRRKSSIVSASTRYKHFNSREQAQRDFNNLSVKERGKFESENTSNYGGVDYGSSRSNALGPTNSQATVAVVTLMLAIDGDSTKVPSISSIGDVEEALRKIAADAKIDDCLQSAEILWTPEDRAETLTLREVVADYPELRSV